MVLHRPKRQGDGIAKALAKLIQSERLWRSTAVHQGVQIMCEYNVHEQTVVLATNLRQKLLPTHITEDDILGMFGDEAPAFHVNFSAINLMLEEITGISGEAVLVPETATHKRTGYYTFYREGQERLFTSARAPEAGPYFIPDHLRR
jgi:hypothetical protein